MGTTFLMILLTILFIVVALYGCVYNRDGQNNFWSVDYTKTLKGLFCIIVVLVHIPLPYQNTIQDMIGSFGYIGVTFFFMSSAYGLKYGVVNKKNYLNSFWENRGLAIVIPAITVNIVSLIVNIIYKQSIEKPIIYFILSIDNWVTILLLYYVVFWILYKFFPTYKYKDIIVCMFVVFTSLLEKFTVIQHTFIWPTEVYGFIYGILFFYIKDKYEEWGKSNYNKKSIMMMVLAGFLGVLYLKCKFIYFWGDYLLKIALGFAIILFLLQITTKIRIGNKINSFLGSISYEIYLGEYVIFKLLNMKNYEFQSATYIYCSVVLIVILATILHFIINKNLIKCVQKAIDSL